jgi:hypothetical protein
MIPGAPQRRAEVRGVLSLVKSFKTEVAIENERRLITESEER